MDPNTLPRRAYYLVTEHAGDLLDFMTLGLSFQLMLDARKMPPLGVFNDFLQCGIDDAPGDRELRWEPFEITGEEYSSLASALQARGYCLEIDTGSTATSYQEWFEAILRGKGVIANDADEGGGGTAQEPGRS